MSVSVTVSSPGVLILKESVILLGVFEIEED